METKDIIKKEYELQKADKWRSFTLISLLTFLCYFITLRFIYPGYFKPLYPQHADNFTYYNSIDAAFSIEQTRFVVILISGLFSEFSFEGFMIGLIAISLLSLVLTIQLVKEITGLNYSYPMIIIYLISVFAHPIFYSNYSFDIYDTISYLFLILTMLMWYRYLKTNNVIYIILYCIFTYLCFFSKETYFIAILIFLGYQILQKTKRKTVLILTVFSITIMILSVYHGGSNGPFIDAEASNLESYYININPLSILRTFYEYIKHWANIGVILLMIAALVCNYLTRGYWKEATLFILMGLSTYVPYSVLPNHIFSMYSWLSVPLSYCVILLFHPDLLKNIFAKYRKSEFKYFSQLNMVGFTIIIIVVLLGLNMYMNKDYKSEVSTWNLTQEKISRNVMKNLPYIKEMIKPGDNILINGLTSPFHPFVNPKFIQMYFNENLRTSWTVAVNDSSQELKTAYYEKRMIKNEDLHNYDWIFSFATDGVLLDTIYKDEIQKLENTGKEHDISDLDLMLYPDLVELRMNYINNPKDTYNLLQIGIIYLTSSNFTKAEFYLQLSMDYEIELYPTPNPYPFFYLGYIRETQKRYTEALEYYKKAIELDDGSNYHFIEAEKRIEDVL